MKCNRCVSGDLCPYEQDMVALVKYISNTKVFAVNPDDINCPYFLTSITKETKDVVVDRQRKEELIIRAIGFYEESPMREESMKKVPMYTDEKIDRLLELIRSEHPDWFIAK